MPDPILTLLGFAVKAGRVSFGMQAAREALAAKKSALIVLAADLSEKSAKEIRFFSAKSAAPVVTLACDMETLSHALGRKAGIVSINDPGFAAAVQARCQNAR